MSATTPQQTYKNAVVFYHWRKCPHSARFMPVWSNTIRPELSRQNVKVWEIEVEENKRALERLGVSLGSGVPRIMFFNRDGLGVAHTGVRSPDSVLRSATTHLGLIGGGDSGGSGVGVTELETVTPAFVAENLPITVLYFRHSCGYCVRFLPTFTKFSQRHDVGRVVGVDTSVHPDAMGALQANAQSPGVPHVVYHSADGTQTPFQGERTEHVLRSFVKRMSGPVSRNVSFEGGSTMPVSGSAEVRMGTALNKLQDQAARVLGKRYRRVFEPENASVTFVSVRAQDVPTRDRVYILFSPDRQPRGKPTAHAAVYGSRAGELTTKIYVDKDIHTLLRNKRSAGFAPVRETNPYVHALQTFGYHVGLS